MDESERGQWRLILLVAVTVAAAFVGWFFYTPGFSSLLSILAFFLVTAYRRLSGVGTQPIKFRSWMIIFLLVVGLPIFVIVSRWHLFAQLLFSGPPPVLPGDRFIISAVSVVNGLAFTLTLDLLKPTYQYFIRGKGQKPDGQPLHVWVIAVVTLSVGVLFAALAASAPQVK